VREQAEPRLPERDKATRLGRPEPARELLRRQVREAVSRPTSTTGFFDELRGAGLLVKERLSPATGDLTGYAVAVAGGDLNGRGQPVYFGGGRLASDLTLPKVRARYGEASAVHPVTSTAPPESSGAGCRHHQPPGRGCGPRPGCCSPPGSSTRPRRRSYSRCSLSSRSSPTP